MKSFLIKQAIKVVHHLRRGKDWIRKVRASLFSKFNESNYKSIPIIICNFNRLEFLKLMIESLKDKGYENIMILDNASTYPPLLDYYSKDCSIPVHFLNQNYGHTALWDSGVINKFNNDYFVYSDPDLVFSDSCPDDILLYMLKIIKKHPRVDKIAASLRLDDIPDQYPLKNEVLRNEMRFFEKTKYGCYVADVDTTFALYTPNASAAYHEDDFTLRTPVPYQMRHLPWYQLEETEEDRFYKSHKRKEIGWWIR